MTQRRFICIVPKDPDGGPDCEVRAPTLEERALYIAEEANECCNRSDGYEGDIYKIALTMLQEAVAEAATNRAHSEKKNEETPAAQR